MSHSMATNNQPKFQLRRGGYAIRKSQVSQKEKKRLIKDLHVKPNMKGQIGMMPAQPFPIYRESLTRFYVPRHYGMDTFGTPMSDVLQKGEPCPSLEFTGSLRDKQIPVIETFKKSNGGGVISVPCGFGKTCCAIYLACWLKRKTLVVVHKNFLLSQWIERIQSFAPKARIGRIQGKVIDIENKDIVIGMLQSLSMKEYEPSVFKGFGFTVIDECHHISAEVFSRALPMLGSRWNLGLSATPDRADGLSKVFYWHLGPLLYPKKEDISVRPETSEEETSAQCVVKKIEYYHTDPSYSQEPETAMGKPNTARMITQVCEWHRRNLLLLAIIQLCVKQKRVLLVLSDRRAMLEALQTMIGRKMPSVSVGQYVGGMKQVKLDESAKCDVILSTYAMSSEGMDIPRINTVILASPKSNVEQSVGRAQRKLHANGVWLFDIVDMFSLFPRQWERRKAFYRKYVSTGSYKKQRYPIEVYRVQDEHNTPVELLEVALMTPVATQVATPPKQKATAMGYSFVEESL